MADWRPLERVQAVFSPTAALRRRITLMAAGKTGPAFQLYARAGRTGLAETEYRVGCCYLDGVGVPCDPPGALALFEKAAANGHPAAMFANGVIYSGVYGVLADDDACQHWFRAAAEHGHPAAQIMLERHVARKRRRPSRSG